ncbi:hypothetical protein ACU8KH_06674 [Lachancea thermotolerans]
MSVILLKTSFKSKRLERYFNNLTGEIRLSNFPVASINVDKRYDKALDITMSEAHVRRRKKSTPRIRRNNLSPGKTLKIFQLMIVFLSSKNT